MNKIVLIIIMIVFGSIESYSNYFQYVDREMRYNYVLSDCINKGIVESECYKIFQKRWEKHLDSIIIDFKTKLKENSYIEESKLFDLNQETWQRYYESQSNFDQKFLWNIWIGYRNHSFMKAKVIKILITRCIEIEDDIENLEKSIELKKEEEND